MGTDAEELYAEQAAAFHADDLERDFADAQDHPFFTELTRFLRDDLKMSVGERDFKELWFLGYNLNYTHDELEATSLDDKITGKKHETLVRAANKMMSQMDLHARFLAKYVPFPFEIFHNKTLAISRKTLERVAQVGREILRPDYSLTGEEDDGNIVESRNEIPDFAKVRVEYIMRLAAWWERVAGSAPTRGRDRAPFVRLCKLLKPVRC